MNELINERMNEWIKNYERITRSIIIEYSGKEMGMMEFVQTRKITCGLYTKIAQSAVCLKSLGISDRNTLIISD